MGPGFFGLTSTDREYVLEQVFLLMYYGGFTYTEASQVPIQYRIWFINRIGKEIEKSNGQSKATDQNEPGMAALLGKHRGNTPARMHRFT